MRRRTVGVRLAGTWCALLLFLALFGHSSRWWLYFLTAALLVLTIGTLFFALARGPSGSVVLLIAVPSCYLLPMQWQFGACS